MCRKTKHASKSLHEKGRGKGRQHAYTAGGEAEKGRGAGRISRSPSSRTLQQAEISHSFIIRSTNMAERSQQLGGGKAEVGGTGGPTHPASEYLSALSVPPPALPQNVYICKKKLRAVPHLRLLAEGQPLLARGRTFPSRMRNNIKTASVG